MDSTYRAPGSSIPAVPVSLLVQVRGETGGTTAAQSHYNLPIVAASGALHGRTRNWGDIAVEDQKKVIDALVASGRNTGWNTEEIAFLLAVARTESGFNPDAAAKTTSASGLGQFIDATAAGFSIGNGDRFDLRANISAMLRYLKQCLNQAAKRLPNANAEEKFAYAYALYHDGPSLKYGGTKIAQLIVLPWTQKYLAWLAGGE